MDLRLKVGKLTISLDLYTRMVEGNHPSLQQLFSVFYPLKIENIYDKCLNDELIFTGVSSFFRTLEIGEIIPEYEVTFLPNKNISFKEIKE